ncbi:alpha/beta hydrolase family protein [Actinosynnema sp. CS-041913]|uniref:alpha/beta hydrolase family protein n=1 Tax=Actinosynnema sp. CS-041913 TaxID=3239917 RepID=UPI003D910ADF
MRLTKLLLPALLVAGLATPVVAAAEPAAGPPPPGWTYTGAQLVWTAPTAIPAGDAAIEFWDGDRLLGVPRPSADQRTYTLDRPRIGSADGLQVRAAGRRLDAEEPVRPLGTTPPPAPAPLAAGAVDPGKPGPFRTRTGEYALDPITVPGYPAPIEMQAVVVAPKGLPGKRPLALFLHGRHFTCYDPDDPNRILLSWPCPADAKPVPSHRGYLQAQQLLASQGYVTVSVSANGVNAQDAADVEAGAGARSALVRAHLAKWADWAGPGRGSAPEIVRAAPAADLANVFLVGHSRGGEGVNRAATDSITPPPPGSGHDGPARWTIKGDLLIGPTIFGHNPAPDVPSVTILPGCDGDVSDLQGQLYLDATRGFGRGAALHSALYFVGANHNYFNTEWTPGQAAAPASDDFFPLPPDAVCSSGTPTRLTAEQQQTAGATYIAAAARLFIAGDQRVLPLLDGSGVRAPSADPARVLSHAVGGARTPFVVPDDATAAGGSARMCAQVPADPDSACVFDPSGRWGSPHFTWFRGIRPEPGRFAVALEWSAEGRSAVVRPGQPVSLAGARDLALRLIVPPNTVANRFDVAVTDTAGRRAQLGSVSLDGLPATERLSARWAQEVRVPLPSHGVDLRQVAALELVPRAGAGQAWLIDAHGWSHGLPDPRPAALPRVDVGELTVEEGDSGTRTVQVPVAVSGDGAGSVRLFINDENGRTYTQRLVTLQPGQHRIEIPMEVAGNTRWSSGSRRALLVKAVQGTVAGRYAGGLRVLDDDPEPTLTVTPAAEVAEGGVLTWRVTLSAAADEAILRLGAPIAPAGAPELSSTDVDAEWFRRLANPDEPLPSRPLSTTRLRTFLYVPPGELSTEITVPTVADTEAEPAEQVRLHFTSLPPGGSEFTVVGTVTDPATPHRS